MHTVVGITSDISTYRNDGAFNISYCQLAVTDVQLFILS